jgi:hypothetical protein
MNSPAAEVKKSLRNRLRRVAGQFEFSIFCVTAEKIQTDPLLSEGQLDFAAEKCEHFNLLGHNFTQT